MAFMKFHEAEEFIKNSSMDQETQIWAIRQLDAMTQDISIIDGAIFDVKETKKDFSITAYTKSTDETDFALAEVMLIDKPSKIDRFIQKLFREKTATFMLNVPPALRKHKTLNEFQISD